MVRDTADDKIDYLSCRFGPMFRRWNEHLTKGRKKYPDPKPGVPNWTLAEGEEELERARKSAARHFEQWLAGDTDEDHAAAVYFNINLAEYVLDKMNRIVFGADTNLYRAPTKKSDPWAGTCGFHFKKAAEDHLDSALDKLSGELRGYLRAHGRDPR